jgi:hypothetical protein
MIKRHYHKVKGHIDRRKFRLLLIATFLVLILPVFFGKGLLSSIVFVLCMSFLLIQSMIISRENRPKYAFWRYLMVIILLILFWLEPFGYRSPVIDSIRFVLLASVFVFITFYLLRFLKKSKEVNLDVLIVAVNIYLLMGIIAGSLTFLLHDLYPDSYNIPANITNPNFVTFTYYSFITMSTVGYGDITPRIPETQTIGYLIAVTGQLYVAIIVAFLVGKLLVHQDKKE